MTCQEQWETIQPGSRVRFKDGTIGIKLAEQRERYTGINEYCIVEKDGLIDHISCYVNLHEPYSNQFVIVSS